MLTRRYLLLTLPPVAAGGWMMASRSPEAVASVHRETLQSAPSPVLSAAVPPVVRPIDSSPQRILVIGDSMVHNLMPLLADYCLENGHYLHPAIWWGSTSMGWAGSAKITELLIKHQPTFILVVLGSSEIISKNIDAMATSAVRRLLERVGERKLAWIGPPNWREDTGINATLERELGKGRFFRSAELVLDREDDGIHPTPKGGRVWAEHFLRWLADESDVPILLKPPTRVARVPGATSYGAAWEVPDPKKKTD